MAISKISDVKIRSYMYSSHTMVKDHRTGFESGNVSDAVLDGGLDGFISAYLKWERTYAGEGRTGRRRIDRKNDGMDGRLIPYLKRWNGRAAGDTIKGIR